MVTQPQTGTSRPVSTRLHPRSMDGSCAAVAAVAAADKPTYTPGDPMLSVRESAAEAGMSVSSWWRGVRAKRLPAATYVTPRSPRWRLSEIRAALEALRGAR